MVPRRRRQPDGSQVEERGASVVEYAILVALIAIVCLVAVQFFGGRVSNNFSTNASSVGSA